MLIPTPVQGLVSTTESLTPILMSIEPSVLKDTPTGAATQVLSALTADTPPVPTTPVLITQATTTPVPTTHRSDVGILGATEVDTPAAPTHIEPLVTPDTTIGAATQVPSHITADTLPAVLTPIVILPVATTPVPTTHRFDVDTVAATEVDTPAAPTHIEPLVTPDTTIGAATQVPSHITADTLPAVLTPIVILPVATTLPVITPVGLSADAPVVVISFQVETTMLPTALQDIISGDVTPTLFRSIASTPAAVATHPAITVLETIVPAIILPATTRVVTTVRATIARAIIAPRSVVEIAIEVPEGVPRVATPVVATHTERLVEEDIPIGAATLAQP